MSSSFPGDPHKKRKKKQQPSTAAASSALASASDDAEKPSAGDEDEDAACVPEHDEEEADRVEEEEEEEGFVLLGVSPSDPSSFKLPTHLHQLSKLGGDPDWVLPDSRAPTCPRCEPSAAMRLVAQIYAPFGQLKTRTLYVFVCGQHEDVWRLVRQQLPPVPLEEEEVLGVPEQAGVPKQSGDATGLEDELEALLRLQEVQSAAGSKKNPKKTAPKPRAPKKPPATPPPPLTGSPLAIEYEPSFAEDFEHERRLLEAYTSQLADLGDPDEKPVREEEFVSKSAPDAREFVARLRRAPGQAFRYPAYGTRALLPEKRKASSPPKCERCGSERGLEAQLMPRACEFLETEMAMTRVEFATVLLSTCRESCGDAAEEHLLVVSED